MIPSLGGPGLACSSMHLRRLLAGELGDGERARVEEHLRDCGRCQASRAEIEAEAASLAEALPFERFAAGVAERLASPPAPPARRRPGRLAPMALAAGLAAVAAVPLLVRISDPGPGSDSSSEEGEALRSKGGARLELFAQLPAGARALAAGEPMAAGVRLRAVLHPGRWREAALVLLDRDGPAVLHAGPARPGPLPEAFEWTGEAGEGTLLLVLADEPIDAGAVRDRLARGEAAAPPGKPSEVVTLRLRREASR